jgi:RNA polymerase sigma factor (sigma-70 family)
MRAAAKIFLVKTRLGLTCIGRSIPATGLPPHPERRIMDLQRETRHSLIRNASLHDEAAWVEFVHQYSQFIRFILRQVGVEPDDIEDVTQQILVKLTTDIANYDRSKALFRTWLSSVIRHTAINHLKKHRRYQSRFILGDYVDLEERPGPSSAGSEIDGMIEREWTLYISNLAMKRVREAFQGKAIETFELGLENHSAAEVASMTGLSVASVYTLQKRVRRRLYMEIRTITQELEP